MNQATATVRVSRTKAARDFLAVYKVLIDDEAAGSLRNGKSQDYPVDPGEHSVFIRVFGKTSPVMKVTVQSGERVELVCRPGGSMLATPYDSFFRRQTYIDLRPGT